MAAASDEIVQDKSLLATKGKMMAKLRNNSLLNSVGRIATFMAGIMLTTAMAVITMGIKEKGAHTFSEVMSAIGSSEVGLGFLAIAGVATAVAVGADYVASRIWHSGQFDNLEVNAQSTAHHLVQELKQNNLCLTEGQSKGRSDSKTWAQVEQIRQQQSAQQQLTPR